MIPDFPTEKEKLMKFWNKYLTLKNKELLGPFSNIQGHTNYEGHQWKLNRSDGSGESQPYYEIQGMLNVEISEVPNLTPEKIKLK
jgi:hypothetical protein